MMRYGLWAILLLLSTASVWGQDSLTVSRSQPVDSFEIHKVLIIPFNPRMFVSDDDRAIREKAEISYPQLVDRLRAGLSVAVRQHIPGWWESEILDTGDSARLDKRIYQCLSYRYELLDEKTMGQKKEFLKPEGKSDKKIVDGQVAIPNDNRPKFMNIALKNDTLLSWMQSRYHADHVLFLNQLDLQSDLSDYAATGNKTYKRFFNVHFTLMDKDGKTIFAGLSRSYFPSEEKELQTIINQHLDKAALGVAQHMPSPKPVKKLKSVK